MSQVMIVDDEPIIRDALRDHLREQHLETITAGSGEAALQMLEEAPVDVLVTDIRMSGMSGLELLVGVRERFPDTQVIVMTAYASTETVITALRQGAYDYIIKPVEFEDITHKVRHLLRHNQLLRENLALKSELHQRYSFHNIIARSEPMQEVFRMIETVAGTDSNVLIFGASGTGKELVAKAIHYNSRRKNQRFLPVNLSAIPETLIESELFGHRKGAFTGAIRDKDGYFAIADGGTLFLDEISEIPIHLQVKLLRAIEQREVTPVGATEPLSVNIRLIAATNRDLRDLIAQGKFREDLYYRLNVVEIPLPGLNERSEDIPVLAQHFVGQYASEMKKQISGISTDAMAYLRRHEWRGNVRELENSIERAVIFCDTDTILPQHLPVCIRQQSEEDVPDDLREAVVYFEHRHIKRLLERCGQDKNEVAQRLGISLSSLYRKLQDGTSGENEDTRS